MIEQELVNRVPAHAGHARGRPQAVALDQREDDLDPLRNAQDSCHSEHYA